MCVSFNEIRQILNPAQIMALSQESPSPNSTTNTLTSFSESKMITLDGDQTLYADGANFESNPKLALYLESLLRNGVTIAVVTAAGYEYQAYKYQVRLSGLLRYFQQQKLPPKCCRNFYLFGGECNYLLQVRVHRIFFISIIFVRTHDTFELPWFYSSLEMTIIYIMCKN